MFDSFIPLSLYIHLPWCVRKCPYCDFNSHALKEPIPEERYAAALLKDLECDLNQTELRPLTSIYFGGGTPSLFSPAIIERILTGVAERIPFVPEIEITMEANPGTVDEDRFIGFRQAGVNRLSIGVQSFQKEKLIKLGRIHDDITAKSAFDKAKKAGFTNFNIDIMYGLPGQSVKDALFDIDTALELAPTHFSWYQLTLEPNTLFYHQPPQLPDEKILHSIQELGFQNIQSYGFKQYEVSAYSLADKQCAHNLNYWQFGDYLGIGAGAHSKLTNSKQQTCMRLSKIKNPRDYLNAFSEAKMQFTDTQNKLEKSDFIFDFMLNALRLQQPIPFTLFTQRTGLTFADVESVFMRAKEKELLEWDEHCFYPTPLGRRFLNDLTAMFL